MLQKSAVAGSCAALHMEEIVKYSSVCTFAARRSDAITTRRMLAREVVKPLSRDRWISTVAKSTNSSDVIDESTSREITWTIELCSASFARVALQTLSGSPTVDDSSETTRAKQNAWSLSSAECEPTVIGDGDTVPTSGSSPRTAGFTGVATMESFVTDDPHSVGENDAHDASGDNETAAATVVAAVTMDHRAVRGGVTDESISSGRSSKHSAKAGAQAHWQCRGSFSVGKVSMGSAWDLWAFPLLFFSP